MILRPAVIIALLPVLAGATAVVDDRLPAYVLQVPDSVSDVFVADAAENTMYRFENSPAGLRLAGRHYMSIGENGMGKKRAWDRKTPLGTYFVVDRLDTTRLHDKYGVAAYPLDYPNAWDRRRQRTGDGIWVHGVPVAGGRRPPRDTDGCLALSNESLLALEGRLVPQVTPVIVTRQLAWATPAARDALRRDLDTALRKWSDALAEGDVFTYLSMYADGFRYRGLSFVEWSSLRARVLEARGRARILVTDLLLLADAGDDGLFLSRFRQTVVDGETTTTTAKRLYWRRDGEGSFRIVAEDNG